MSVSIVFAADATHSNIAAIPPGALAIGYSTGSPDIRWTAADWAAHPRALRIDQDWAASDPTADYLDVENGAATFADCPVWAKQAMADFNSAKRPGQRKPAVYCSQSNIHNVANALKNGGVKFPVGLVIANWNLTEASAGWDVLNEDSGPFPVVGVQFTDVGAVDLDVFNSSYVNTVSGPKPPPPPPPAGLHRHVTGKNQSIEDVAKERNVEPPVNLALRSMKAYTAQDWSDLGDAVEKGGAESLMTIRAEGIPYYTINP